MGICRDLLDEKSKVPAIPRGCGVLPTGCCLKQGFDGQEVKVPTIHRGCLGHVYK